MQRPEHEDFAKMCEILVKMDGEAEDSPITGKDLPEIIGLDGNTLSYVAMQRALRARMFLNSDELTKLAATWLDGFAAGKRWNEDGLD